MDMQIIFKNMTYIRAGEEYKRMLIHSSCSKLGINRYYFVIIKIAIAIQAAAIDMIVNINFL